MIGLFSFNKYDVSFAFLANIFDGFGLGRKYIGGSVLVIIEKMIAIF